MTKCRRQTEYLDAEKRAMKRELNGKTTEERLKWVDNHFAKWEPIYRRHYCKVVCQYGKGCAGR